MKSQIVKISISSVLFIALLFTALILVRPLCVAFERQLTDYRTTALRLLEEKTGLRLSYASISPSILSAFKIKGVAFYDAETGVPVLEIDRAVLSYKIGALLRGRFDTAFTKLTVNGIALEYDAMINYRIIEKLLALVSSRTETETQQSPVVSGAFNLSIPFDIEVKNISLHYSDASVDARVVFKSADIKSMQQGSLLSVSVNAKASAVLSAALLAKLPAKVASALGPVSASFQFDAAVTPDLDGSSAKIKVLSLNSGSYSLARTGLFAEYKDGSVKLASMQNALPFFVNMEITPDTGDFAVRVETDNFDPFTWIGVKSAPPIVNRIRGSLISGLYEFSYSGDSRSFQYRAAGHTRLSARLVPGDMTVAYEVSGDKTDVALRSVRVTSRSAEFSMEGSFHIPTLQPSGTAFLDHYVLPNGGTVSAELYIDPLERGFMCFVPQLYLDDRSFTALQLTVIPDPKTKSADFSFEVSDYSHADFEAPGVLTLDGSFIGGETPYVQSRISISNFFLDTAITAGAFFMNRQTQDSLRSAAAFLSPYVLTNEFYVATDFSTVTYNVPYSIIANTVRDQEFLVFSVTGNESSVHVSKFDLLYAGQSVQASFDADIADDFYDMFFTADLAVNSIPYSLSGSFVPGSWIGVTGDYGLDAAFTFGSSVQNRGVSGSLKMDNLPLALGKSVLSVSLDTAINFPYMDSFTVDVNRFELTEATNRLGFAPHVSLSGQINRFGFMLNSLGYSDTVSLLEGSGGIMWNLSESGLDSASLDIALSNPLSSEAYSVNATLSNPEHKPFSAASVLSDFYFSSQISVSSFPMARVRKLQSAADVCSGTIVAMGSLENPFVSVQVDTSSVSVGGVPVVFSGGARLDDGTFFIDSANVSYGRHHVSDIAADFDVASFAGSLTARYDGALATVYTVAAPFKITLSGGDSAEKSAGILSALNAGVPDVFAVELEAELGGSVFETPETVKLSLLRSPGRFDIYSSGDLGINGSLSDGGAVLLTLDGRFPLHGTVSGTIRETNLDVDLRNMSADLASFRNLVSFPFITLYGGALSGNAHVGGFVADPEFSGVFRVKNMDLNCPDFVTEHITAADVRIAIVDNELRIDNTAFKVKNGSVVLDLSLVLDRWRLDHLSLGIKTPQNVMIPANISAPPVNVVGMSTCDLSIYVTLDSATVSGSFFADNVEVAISTDTLASKSGAEPSTFDVNLDFNVTTGQRVQIVFSPLLRGLVEPNTDLLFQYDSAASDFVFKGDVVLRGGEILYLSRNFYLREGRIVFNEMNGSFDPRLTVRAEIRERDAEGEPVRIILSAENQRLSEFNPTYSSSPPKSELELMSMLGQAFTGDIRSGWDALLTGVDYGFQIFALSKVENALRDLLNFDIFSIRTMGVQKILKQWLNVGSDGKVQTIGNLFDNTTVYIGKYFGSSIYADALLHFTYDESRTSGGNTTSGLVFQPEIGLEMDSPFATIRWSIAPEIGTTQHLWVPATSISLSWKFVF
ncbi:translocation/assembly module TamB domain-containing protein [Treponema brennaborense]|uniref:Translocation and assembly module TamB C-terminal domain-containing protein n=1 Tax=Treponema brennaborense (strain DSM 12168 / CIP 105900 / DD5/3) TaxID=906968 RepID=F4LPL2_TREBD|nr:translocation/assembly module TamB domain-containing protein [Treponema brennaborense]AEE17008.1 protein of unknown function DUF490 [Treponema brennaborense DSM 12168]